VLRGFDGDVRRVVGGELRKRGIDLRLATDVTRITQSAAGLELELQDGQVVTADQVLYATGRVPNVRASDWRRSAWRCGRTAGWRSMNFAHPA